MNIVFQYGVKVALGRSDGAVAPGEYGRFSL